MKVDKNLIKFARSSTTKNKVLREISNRLTELKIVNNSNVLYEAFLEREKEFSTSVGEGFAIPHAINDSIKEPTIFFYKNEENIDWGESIDGKPIKFVLAIIVPKKGRDDHFKILTTFSQKLADENFLNDFKKYSKEEILDFFKNFEREIKQNNKNETKKKEEVTSEAPSENIKTGNDNKYIIAITACPTGIAHTFMAAEKLKKAAKRKGYEVKVETQGSDGQQNALTPEDIDRADLIVLAVAVAIKDENRFSGYEFKTVRPEIQKAIAKADQIIDDGLVFAEENVKNGATFNGGANTGGKPKKTPVGINFSAMSGSNTRQISTVKQGWYKTGLGHMMTGISYMIPMIVIGGLLMAVANIAIVINPLVTNVGSPVPIGSAQYAATGNVWYSTMFWINQVGAMAMMFMYPMFSLGTSYSIAGRSGMVPGFLGGLLATGIQTKFAAAGVLQFNALYINGFVPSLFFGAVAIGFIAGYVVKLINEKIKIRNEYITVKTLLLVPLLSGLVVFFAMELVFNPLFGLVNYGIFTGLSMLAGAKYIYGSMIAAATAFDLGGPINKAAGAVALGFNNPLNPALAQEGIDLTARTLAIIIPPIGLGLSTVVAKPLTGRNDIFGEGESAAEFNDIGKQSIILGLIGISEGGIPFMIAWPFLVIPIDIIGSMIGSLLALGLGASQVLPLPAIWGWLLASNAWAYILGLIVGVAIIAISLPYSRLYMIKLEQKRARIKAETYNEVRGKETQKIE